MDRRDFMKKACGAGAGSVLVLAGAGSLAAQSQSGTAAKSPDQAALEACEKGATFSRDWIVNAVGNMEGKLDENGTILVLEECGRACARQGGTTMAEKNKGNMETFIAELKTWLGETGVIPYQNTVTLIMEKCYCPNVAKLEKVPAAYCNCSRGWAKEMFETVTGTPCEVDLLSSVKRGDKVCKLVVTV
jgi:predicted hydrocarbon binding protein